MHAVQLTLGPAPAAIFVRLRGRASARRPASSGSGFTRPCAFARLRR